MPIFRSDWGVISRSATPEAFRSAPAVLTDRGDVFIKSSSENESTHTRILETD